MNSSILIQRYAQHTFYGVAFALASLLVTPLLAAKNPRTPLQQECTNLTKSLPIPKVPENKKSQLQELMTNIFELDYFNFSIEDWFWFFPTTEQKTPLIHAMVKKIAARQGIPTPKIFIVKNDWPLHDQALTWSPRGQESIVMIGETLLLNTTEEQAEAIIAHELGHIKHNHSKNRIIIKYALYAFAFVFMTFTISLPLIGWLNPWDLVTCYPWLGALVNRAYGCIASNLLVIPTLIPLYNAYLKANEKQADLEAIATIDNPQALATALKKYDTQPHDQKSFLNNIEQTLFDDHPEIKSRIQYCIQAANKKNAHQFNHFAMSAAAAA
ncbi:M48 family metalloprotease [Candidatus Babeliales bacterium]|nr:M48 family metalloprotease [Candidatus Babeliales bacterium]